MEFQTKRITLTNKKAKFLFSAIKSKHSKKGQNSNKGFAYKTNNYNQKRGRQVFYTTFQKMMSNRISFKIKDTFNMSAILQGRLRPLLLVMIYHIKRGSWWEWICFAQNSFIAVFIAWFDVPKNFRKHRMSSFLSNIVSCCSTYYLQKNNAFTLM